MAGTLTRLGAKLFALLNVDDLLNGFLEKSISRERDGGAGRRFQIVMYHRVSPDLIPYSDIITPEVFERQIAFLSLHYNVLDLDAVVQRSRSGDIPAKAVAITFDDGYADNYEFAFPILGKYGVPATVFLATGSLDNRNTLWHERVFDAFRYATCPRARLKGWPDLEIQLETESAARRSFEAVVRLAKQLPTDLKICLVGEVEEALQPDMARHRRLSMLSWDQVREMHRAGIQFGSHTVTHPILSKVDKNQLLSELLESKEEMESQLRCSISSFAYPNGGRDDYNSDVKNALRKAGYSCAVTTQPGFNLPGDDPFELKRGKAWQKQVDLLRVQFFLQRRGWSN